MIRLASLALVASALTSFSQVQAQSVPLETRFGDVKFTSATVEPTAAEVADVVCRADSSGDLGGTHFLLYSAGDATKYAVWYDVDNGSTAPVVADATLVEVDISADDVADTVGSATASAIDALSDFSASNSSGTVTITNAAKGASTDVADVDTTHTSFTTTTQGVSGAVALSTSDVVKNMLGFRICVDSPQTATWLAVGTDEDLDPELAGRRVEPLKCFDCLNCTPKTLKSVRLSGQATATGYSVVQYRQ